MFRITGSVAIAVLAACSSNRGTAGVGPPITIAPAAVEPASAELTRTGLAVVSWNLHEGRGDIPRLLASLRPAHVVLLLQEATRKTLPETARALNVYASYVPSMPNRILAARDEYDDRGCAIVSTLPIVETTPIELPWIYQRRVVVFGSVRASVDGQPTHLRFVSLHLDNRPGRKQQARWLADALKPFAASGSPVIVGGDLNTWFGAKENTVKTIDAVVPRVPECGDGPTFRFGLRLDYLFTTTPVSWVRRCDVLDDTFGSDHYPIVLRLLR